MNNEETITMQPKNEAGNAAELNNATSVKEEKKINAAGRLATTAAAGAFGGVAGGAASVAATNMINSEDPVEEEIQEEVVVATAKPEPQVAPEPVVETKTEEIEEVPVTVDEEQEEDYANQQSADPVVQETGVTSASNSSEDEPEVEILGVYERTDENGVHQEIAILTNGEEIAAVLDSNGDREADIIGIDHNHNEQFDEGEIYDISEQHVGMEQFEQQYLAQQQEEIEQQDSYTSEANDEQDYDNDVDFTMV